MTKKEAIKIITSAASSYKEKMCEKQFLVAYREGGELHYSIVGFKAKNFKHFTGVVTNDTAGRFFEKALNNKLSEKDFDFDKIGNTLRKLTVLPALPRLFYGNALRGDFNNSGISIDADYYIGGTAVRIAVAFRRDKTYDFPVSLYCEDVRKLTNRTTKVLAVWCRSFGDSKFTQVTYCAKDIDAGTLLAELNII